MRACCIYIGRRPAVSCERSVDERTIQSTADTLFSILSLAAERAVGNMYAFIHTRTQQYTYVEINLCCISHPLLPVGAGILSSNLADHRGTETTVGIM